MNSSTLYRGNLFAEDFLRESVTETPDWQNISDTVLDKFESDLKSIFAGLPVQHNPNEAQTEDDLIWPIIERLGWTHYLRQQSLSVQGRTDIPDGILFNDESTKVLANGQNQEWKRYGYASVMVESKRWLRPLDRRSGTAGEESAPSTQMLRYLRRVDDLTAGKLRWGILTNGSHWRLYYSGARLVSEDYFEINIAAILNIEFYREEEINLTPDARRHWLKMFMLIFERAAFLPDSVDERTFHQRVIEESRFYQQKVAESLSEVVFQQVFPQVAHAISEAAPHEPLHYVRDATLILLYRLLFILYAEDRNLLPVRDSRYDDYALRYKVRENVGRRKDHNDVFSETATQYWTVFSDLCRSIETGDASIGLPTYNGGLFDRKQMPILDEIRLSDAVMAKIIDALSFERTPEGRHYINYRDLGVQQLGSIYERLLEREIFRDGGSVVTRANLFARKDSGSYYTPIDLVNLVIQETLDSQIQKIQDEFSNTANKLKSSSRPEYLLQGKLKLRDPAQKILSLKICDPAMGSGHFLVNLVDYLTDKVIESMAEAESIWVGYTSPVLADIDNIRNTILGNAEESQWAFDPIQLDDRHIIRRIVLKRCVFGVDKNPMAVELAKVSLWLHTFTVGAPLGFLDHHLRCGDSLFGTWIADIKTEAQRNGKPLFLEQPLNEAIESAKSMLEIERLADIEIAEAHKSADLFKSVTRQTTPLNSFMSILFAIKWMNLTKREERQAYYAYLDGVFGDPVEIAKRQTFELARAESAGSKLANQFALLFDSAMDLIESERFLNWQITFSTVWSNWSEVDLAGGFDAVIGNPPWDRMKLQQVEWFASRNLEVAMEPRAADRKRRIRELEENKDPLSQEFTLATEHIISAMRIARSGGDYHLLSSGDLNIYSLFVERALKLVKPEGFVGLLVPSGIASDKTAARFFKSVATQGRLKALYDFENRRTRYNLPSFFSDVDSRFKFCAFVAGRSAQSDHTKYACFLQDTSELNDPERCFPLSSHDFARVNPNTGTAPIFRTRRDATITTLIYSRLPVLVDSSSGKSIKSWPVRYLRMFDMTNDSHLFRTRKELEEKEGAWPIGNNRFDSPSGEWVPLYVGRMLHQFDHRAACVKINEQNLHNPALSSYVSVEQKSDPSFSPTPQYWVRKNHLRLPSIATWTIAFRDITNTTNARTMIAAAVPVVGLGNTAPIIYWDSSNHDYKKSIFLLANFGTIVFDFVARQKVQGTHMNWYIIEQLPVVPPEHYDSKMFGSKKASELVQEVVLELTYTAHDMAPFAQDLGYVDESGDVLPPFRWDVSRRLELRAKLDAIYFHLYGITNRSDISHIYSTFPIIEQDEMNIWNSYRSRDLCMAWVNALAAGDTDATIDL